MVGRLVHWSSADTSVATVSLTGLVNAITGGHTTISAEVDGHTATAQAVTISAVYNRWNATVDGRVISILLNEMHYVVSGSGTISNPNQPLVATGTFINPNLTLKFNRDPSEPISFIGTLSGDVLVGTLNGAGYSNEPVLFTHP